MKIYLLLSVLAGMTLVVEAIRADLADLKFSLSSVTSKSTRPSRRPNPIILSALVLPEKRVKDETRGAPEGADEMLSEWRKVIARQASQPSSELPSPGQSSSAQPTAHSSWSPFLNKEHYRGLNVANQAPTGSHAYMTDFEWDKFFAMIKTLPGKFNAVRLYSTTGTGDDQNINHLDLALPAAAKHELMIHTGVWSGGDANTQRFNLEKQALIQAIKNHGCSNIAAISVGNEDILRNYTEPNSPLMSVNLLIEQINEISLVLDENNCCNIPVTHTDTWAEWTNPENAALVKAVDFVTVNVFPYWEKSSIDQAHDQFWTHINSTIEYAAQFGKEVWLGETGWPFNGSANGAAVPSIANQQTYFSNTACSVLNSMNAFIYVFWDNSDTAAVAAPAFGLWDEKTGMPRITLGCNPNFYPAAGGL